MQLIWDSRVEPDRYNHWVTAFYVFEAKPEKNENSVSGILSEPGQKARGLAWVTEEAIRRNDSLTFTPVQDVILQAFHSRRKLRRRQQQKRRLKAADGAAAE